MIVKSDLMENIISYLFNIKYNYRRLGYISLIRLAFNLADISVRG